MLWQLLQSAEVWTWVADFPVAVVPLWHEEHVPTTCVWSTLVAGFHAVVAWQDSQVFVVLMCPLGLPVVWVLSWQLEQPLVIPA